MICNFYSNIVGVAHTHKLFEKSLAKTLKGKLRFPNDIKRLFINSLFLYAIIFDFEKIMQQHDLQFVR